MCIKFKQRITFYTERCTPKNINIGMNIVTQIKMVNEDIITQISRNLVSELFPDTYRGRTLSRMTADALGTDTRNVHGFMALGFLIWLGSRRD